MRMHNLTITITSTRDAQHEASPFYLLSRTDLAAGARPVPFRRPPPGRRTIAAGSRQPDLYHRAGAGAGVDDRLRDLHDLPAVQYLPRVAGGVLRAEPDAQGHRQYHPRLSHAILEQGDAPVGTRRGG